MDCPFCKYNDTKVIRTLRSDDGLTITRRRECPRCGARFTTLEAIELQIIKHDGSREPFSRAKVINGVRKASQNLDIKDEDFKKLGLEVEEDLKARGEAEISSDEVGKAILKPLRDLNDVAYLRFASVYQDFSSLDDFKRSIGQLEDYHRHCVDRPHVSGHSDTAGSVDGEQAGDDTGSSRNDMPTGGDAKD